jgi:hypothetical protein
MKPEPKLQRPTDETTARELAGMKAEPLLPAEKKLILGSITLGLLLLGILLWISGKYFPH